MKELKFKSQNSRRKYAKRLNNNIRKQFKVIFQ